MSSNGNDDDDIDRLVRAMQDTNRNLEDVSKKLDTLVESIIRGSREEAGMEDDELEEDIDLWREGKASPGEASTAEEYVTMRRRTARNPEMSVPQISPDVTNYARFFIDVYTMCGEHLQRVYFALSNSQWKEFIQRLAIVYGADKELVDLVNPGTEMFGVLVSNKDVEVLSTSTHMSFTVAYNNYWFAPTIDVQADKYSGPSSSLQLPEDPDADVVEGSLTPRDVNTKLAEAVVKRGKSLPDRFIGYL